jgi:hypothetical protein
MLRAGSGAGGMRETRTARAAEGSSHVGETLAPAAGNDEDRG